MIKAGIIGGAGYTGGELIRILNHHPDVQLVAVQSRSHAAKPIHIAHPDLEGELTLTFTAELPSDLDVIFLCSGHGNSKKLLAEPWIPSEAKVIDLSADFRIKDDHHEFVYGLPELQKAQIAKAKKVANPGCFATCIQLSLLPLADAGLLNEEVHINAITGSTGAGQNPTDTTHFSWRNNNASVYKAFEHQHLAEIRQSLVQLQQAFEKELHFIPMRGAFARGILATSYLKSDLSEDEAIALYKKFYQDAPFIHITDSSPDVKRVVNTNKALLHLQKKGGQLLITGVIDNLVKGASGQAVQNMNLMFGLEETTGLQLKSIAY